MTAKLNFQQPLLQISLSHDPSEIILTCWMGKQETFLITIFDEEQFKRTESFKNKNLPVYYETLKYTKSLHCLARLTKHWQTYITVTHRLCLKDPSNTSIELNCIAPKVLQFTSEFTQETMIVLVWIQERLRLNDRWYSLHNLDKGRKHTCFCTIINITGNSFVRKT